MAAAVVPVVEERRVVTVVFCDLVGSTALSGRLDPEVLRSVTLRYFDLMRTSLEAHGGTVEKFIGDAVMAVFGVPVMHEDDARRALAATLDMTAALAEFNLELQVNLGIRIDVRIGVNTGEVIAATDPGANQALVSGEVVNVAARLEQNAGPGQVLIGPDTLAAAGAAAVVQPLAPIALKGKTDPVAAFLLQELLSDDPEVLRRFDVPFIGREPELAELELMLDRCRRQRRFQLVNVYGEAGIGKTRLIRQWQQNLDSSSVRLGTGRCHPYGDSGTLTALAEAINQLLETDVPGEANEDLAVLQAGLLKDGTPHPSVSETVAAVASVLSALAQQTAVVLVLDDCHWAAAVLLDVLDELAENLDLEPVLVVCVARPELLDHRPGWGSGQLTTNSMVLQSLTDLESELLAAELAEVGAHDTATTLALRKRAEGNPLHLEQLFASLSEVGRDAPLPPTVYALLAARIDALAGGERLLLDLAAIIGREFDAAGLCRFSDGGEDCTGTLRSLSRRRLIEPLRGRGPQRYRFSNGLIQEVAYNGMSKRVRSERHQRYADCVGNSAGGAELGGHLERAYRYRAELGLADTDGLRLKAARQLDEAGRLARAHADLSWAEDLYDRAFALIGPDEAGWAETARGLAEVRLARGHREPGLQLLHQVLDTASAQGDTGTVAHARLELATHDPSARLGSAADVARSVLDVFDGLGDRLGLARAGVRIAQELQFSGRHGEAEAILLGAAQHAAAAGAEPERALALGAIGISLWRGPTPVDAAIARCQDLLAEHGPNRSAVRVTLNCPLAVLLALRGRGDEAETCLATATPLARSLGYAEAEVFLPLFGATVASAIDQLERAERLLRDGLQAAQRLGLVGLDAAVIRDLARLLLDRGEWVEAASLMAGLSGADPDRLPPSEAADQLGIQARIESYQGSIERALALAHRANVEADRTDSPITRGVTSLDLATVLVRAGQSTTAAAAAEQARISFADKGHLAGVRRATAFIESLT